MVIRLNRRCCAATILRVALEALEPESRAIIDEDVAAGAKMQADQANHACPAWGLWYMEDEKGQKASATRTKLRPLNGVFEPAGRALYASLLLRIGVSSSPLRLSPELVGAADGQTGVNIHYQPRVSTRGQCRTWTMDSVTFWQSFVRGNGPGPLEALVNEVFRLMPPRMRAVIQADAAALGWAPGSSIRVRLSNPHQRDDETHHWLRDVSPSYLAGKVYDDDVRDGGEDIEEEDNSDRDICGAPITYISFVEHKDTAAHTAQAHTIPWHTDEAWAKHEDADSFWRPRRLDECWSEIKCWQSPHPHPHRMETASEKISAVIAMEHALDATAASAGLGTAVAASVAPPSSSDSKVGEKRSGTPLASMAVDGEPSPPKRRRIMAASQLLHREAAVERAHATKLMEEAQRRLDEAKRLTATATALVAASETTIDRSKPCPTCGICHEFLKPLSENLDEYDEERQLAEREEERQQCLLYLSTDAPRLD